LPVRGAGDRDRDHRQAASGIVLFEDQCRTGVEGCVFAEVFPPSPAAQSAGRCAITFSLIFITATVIGYNHIRVYPFDLGFKTANI